MKAVPGERICLFFTLKPQVEIVMGNSQPNDVVYEGCFRVAGKRESRVVTPRLVHGRRSAEPENSWVVL